MLQVIALYSFWGKAARPPLGLCPWTPLGDFRSPDPSFIVCVLHPCHYIIDKSLTPRLMREKRVTKLHNLRVELRNKMKLSFSVGQASRKARLYIDIVICNKSQPIYGILQLLIMLLDD